MTALTILLVLWLIFGRWRKTVIYQPPPQRIVIVYPVVVISERRP